MKRKKLIKKLSIPAGIIAVISILVLLVKIPYQIDKEEVHRAEFKKYINTFMEQNKTYIKEIAAKIKSLPVDQKIVNELQSEYMVDHQKSDLPKKYLWMAGTDGTFLFGVPAGDFEQLNGAYTKYQEVIKSDGYYRNQNDFLLKLIDKHDEIDFSDFDRTQHPEEFYGSGWRYYKPDWYSFFQPAASIFSYPIYDEAGKSIGEIFMKVDDRVNEDKYYVNEQEEPDFYDVLTVIAIVFLSVSGAFLWFLLPTWVYTDAQDRDVKNPGIWAFLALTSLFFGLTIYLITRPNTLKSMNCPQCDGELNGTKAYCPHCGFDLSNTYCQQCQYPIKPEWQFCPNCRAETKEKNNHVHEVKNSLPSENNV
ncbi:MAG: zinc ribbon domain-containing protein [bacterium]